MRFGRKHFVKQLDAKQCGVACLAMLCRFLGKDVSLTDLTSYCHTTVEGISLKGLSEAAAELGLKTAAARLTVDDLAKSPLPCILYWKQSHFVVLCGIKGDKYRIADPAKGFVVVNRDTLLENWAVTIKDNSEKGIAMFVAPTPDFEKCCPTQHSSQVRSFKFLFGYFMQYRKYLFQILLGMGLGCVFELILPFLTQGIVDIGIGHKDVSLIWLILIGEFMIVVGRTVTDFIRRWLLLHISMRINISLLSDFFIKLLRLPMSYFDTKLIGDIMQRMADHSRVENFLTQQCLSILFSAISFLVFSVLLFVYNHLIFTVFAIGSVVYTLWICIFLHRRKILDYELFNASAVNQNRTYQFITAMQEIKLQSCGQRRRWEWEDSKSDLFSVQMKSLKLQQTQDAGAVFINELKNILVTVFAATAVINGNLTLGAMMAVQYIIGQLNAPVSTFVTFVYSLQDVKISLERINDIHKAQEECSEGAQILPVHYSKPITFSNVVFRYDKHSTNDIIRNVTFDVEPGKFTAIVGASGSGKTTLIKLMLGYYPVDGGALCVGDMPIQDIMLDSWRAKCGVVMQDGVIFSESISRNIAVGDADMDMDRLRDAATKACIHDYIMKLPLGYETKIGADGMGLSQGQKQRILIARAIYKAPEYIFLDEATNALDAENERNIVDNLDEVFKGRTVVVVAHRLSTVKNADKIIVLSNGSIAECGNHESLINLKGIYYNLVKNQLELGT